jgi:phospholipase/carboxylesterase
MATIFGKHSPKHCGLTVAWFSWENQVMLAAIEIQTADQPDASIIWLHGLGADGSDFVPVAEELALPFPVRFVFPHAPSMPVTVNGGYRMPAWYDVYTLDIAGVQDEVGIRNSQAKLEELIAKERSRGILPERIVLAGFSQGGAIALHTALRYPTRLAGVLALSTYLPLAKTLDAERSDANSGVPIFMAYGTGDTVIPDGVATRSRERLRAANYPVDWHEYPMAHSVCSAEIDDIRRFLLKVLMPY